MSEGLTLAVWTALLLQPQLGWLVERHPYPSLPFPQAKSLVVPGLRDSSRLFWIPFPKRWRYILHKGLEGLNLDWVFPKYQEFNILYENDSEQQDPIKPWHVFSSPVQPKWALQIVCKDTSASHTVANMHMKRCSTSLTIREMHIKTTLRYHLTPARMVIIKKSSNNKR